MYLDKRLLEWLKPFRPSLITALFFDLLIAMVTVVQAFLLAMIVDLVFLRAKDLGDLTGELTGFFLLSTVRLLLTWLQQKKLTGIGSRLKYDLRSQLIKCVHQRGPIFPGTGQTGDLVSVYGSHIDAIVLYLVVYLPQLWRAAAVPIIILVFIFPLDLLSAFVFLVTAPLIPLFMMLIGSMTETVTRRKWLQLSRMGAFFLDVLQGLTTIKLFGRVEYFLRRIRQISESFRFTSMQVLRIAFLSALVMEMVTTISTAVIAVEIGLRLLYDRLPFSEALFVLIIAPEFYQPMRQLGSRFHTAVEGLTAAEKYIKFLSFTAAKPPESGILFPDLQNISLTFKRVSCKYPEKNEFALTNLTFSLPPKGLTVIVGPSGAGKSSLLALILKFIAPVEGEIMVGESNLDRIPVEKWRRNMSWISQDPYLFNRSVRENIALAKPEASFSEIVTAAKSAQFDSVADSLSRGYDTMVGEQGIRLSAGERQRLALARVFLRNTPLVIMDEPTASLDPHTDDLIQQAITALAADRAVLVVSHRLEIVNLAACTIMLSGGRLIGAGPHKNLMIMNQGYRAFIGSEDD